eukprot:767396-Hanusia_phi.AAC.5
MARHRSPRSPAALRSSRVACEGLEDLPLVGRVGGCERFRGEESAWRVGGASVGPGRPSTRGSRSWRSSRLKAARGLLCVRSMPRSAAEAMRGSGTASPGELRSPAERTSRRSRARAEEHELLRQEGPVAPVAHKNNGDVRMYVLPPPSPILSASGSNLLASFHCLISSCGDSKPANLPTMP